MAGPLVSVSIALGLHLGKKILDKFWEMLSSEGGAIATASSVTPYVVGDGGVINLGPSISRGSGQYQLVTGNLYYPESLYVPSDAVPLLLTVNERAGEVALLGASQEEGEFRMALPSDIYSFYAFVVGQTDDLIEAPILAMGLPSAVDLEGSDRVSFEGDEDGFWDLFTDHPLVVGSDGPYVMDFLMMSPVDVSGLPRSLGDFLGSAGTQYVDVSGEWDLTEEYEFGSTQAQVLLLQVENELSGFVVTHDVMDDGSELLLRERVEGEVLGDEITLVGTDVEILLGDSDGYFLDRWQGTVDVTGSLIGGTSLDEAGTAGSFVMQRG